MFRFETFQQAVEIVGTIHDDLMGRAGFDAWAAEIDGYDYKDMVDTQIADVMAILDKAE